MIEPFIVSINSVPKIAFAPIVVPWFGTGLASKIALAVSLTAIIALVAAYEAAREADPDLQALLLTLGGDKHDVFYPALEVAMATRITLGNLRSQPVYGDFVAQKYIRQALAAK